MHLHNSHPISSSSSSHFCSPRVTEPDVKSSIPSDSCQTPNRRREARNPQLTTRVSFFFLSPSGILLDILDNIHVHYMEFTSRQGGWIPLIPTLIHTHLHIEKRCVWFCDTHIHTHTNPCVSSDNFITFFSIFLTIAFYKIEAQFDNG